MSASHGSATLTRVAEQVVLAVSDPQRTEQPLAGFVEDAGWIDAARELATRHGLMTQLAVVSSGELHRMDLAPPIREALHATARHARYWDSLQVWHLSEMSEAMARAGVPWMLLKGLGLAERLYECPSERLGSDMDILIRRTDTRRVDEILGRLGYVPQNRSFYEETHFHVPYRRGRFGGTATLEVHWDVSPPSSPLRFHPDTWWDRAREVELRLGRTLLPPAECELAHVAWHAFNHGPAKLRDLSDVARLWNRLDSDDAQRLWEYTATTASTGFVAAALGLAAELWDQRAPDRPGASVAGLKQICRDALVRRRPVLDGFERLSAPLARILYWSLVDDERTGCSFLFEDALRDLENRARETRERVTTANALGSLSRLVLGLGYCVVSRASAPLSR